MKDIRILVEPFNFISILKCEIHKQINEHFIAKVVGYISEDNSDELVMKCSTSTKFSIFIQDENNDKKCLFKGVIQDVSIMSKNGLKMLTVNALSYTILLDNKTRIRTFQNENQTYKNVLEFISSQNKNSVFIYPIGSQEKTNGMVVQYNETDWEFIKRMASRLNSFVVSDSQNDNICLCFGNPKKSDQAQIDSMFYETTKNLEEYIFKKNNNVDKLIESDAMEVCVESRNSLEICSKVEFQKQVLIIYKIFTQYIGNELIHKYYLKPINGLKTVKYRNNRIVGASIKGRITQVRNDKVKIKIYSDNDKPDGIDKWFFYSTNYSSPDGTGWYCMPEENDMVRIYFPDDEENNAYVISAVHLGVVDKLRKNPDEKSIRTIFDKEIRMTPNKILITNHNGLSITLDDKKGIIFHSDKDIKLLSSDAVNINSLNTVNISADKGIFLQQGPNSIMIRDGIKEYALKIQHR